MDGISGKRQSIPAEDSESIVDPVSEEHAIDLNG
jgi:hypothetical protein